MFYLRELHIKRILREYLEIPSLQDLKNNERTKNELRINKNNKIPM